MPIFQLPAPKTMRLLSGHILPRNASNFTRIHLDFNSKISQEETPEPCLGKGREWERIKGFLPLTEGEEGKGQGRGKRDGRENKGGQRQGDLAPRSWGKPCHHDINSN